jgi:hypothetical protein
MIQASTSVSEPSTVVLGFGPQPMDWLSKAAKIAGKHAVIDPDVARMAGANLAAGTPEALAELRKRLTPGALAAVDADMPGGAPDGAAEWLASGEHGASSEALFTRLSAIATENPSRAGVLSERDRTAHPYDPQDFRRCRLMLEAVPSLQALLPLAADLSPIWAALVGAWPELCALMDEEFPQWRTGEFGRAPRLYARLKSLTNRE